MENKNDSPAVSQEANTAATNPSDISQEKPGDVKKPAQRVSLYEKNRRAVYSTGNKWAIENFHATHN